MNPLRKASYNKMLQQLRHPEKRTWIILNPVSIGETALTCALAGEFVKRHGYGITLVIRPEQRAIADMFPGRFEKIIEASQEEQNEMQRFLPPAQFELDVPFASVYYSLGDARSDNLFYLFKYPGRGGLSLTDCFRHILMLPWEAKLERPTIPAQWEHEAQLYANQVGIVPGDSVILFPATSTALPQFPDFMWETLVQRLLDNGKKVFCNMKGGIFKPEKMPIKGTISIDVPIHLGISLGRIAGRVISSPNGFQFFQMLGGQFNNMTILAPVGKDMGDLIINHHPYPPTFLFAEYSHPELCSDISYSEFMMPFEKDQETRIKEIAIAAADLNTMHAACVRRGKEGTCSFTEKHQGWQKSLIGPIQTSNITL
jgi:hypothetical protein